MVNNRMLVSKRGRQYKVDVAQAVGRCKPLTGRLKVFLYVNPPDRRKRDVDNWSKGVLDALTHAGVWEDDSQIDSLLIERGGILKGGRVVVTVEEIEK